MTTVLDCIERIPSCLNEIRNTYPERAKRISDYLAAQKIKRVERLIFIASGSSYNSAHAAKLFIKNQCGIEPEFKFPNIFLNYEAEAEFEGTDPSDGRAKNAALEGGNSAAAVYVVISQGGETKLVYRALEKIKAAGKPCIAITADENTSIARLADCHVTMGCGQEEFLYRTIGFSTSAAVCALLGLAAAVFNGSVTPEAEAAYLADFDRMRENLPAVERATEEWYRAHKFSLLRRNKMMMAGTGDLYPIVNEGDIKIMEMVPMMTRSFELEEFIHGPQNSFDDATLFLILHHKGEDDEKAEAIARFIKEQIGFGALVGEEPLDDRDLTIKPASRWFFGLEYVTVFQVLAYRMADDRGRDLSRGVNAVVSRYITKTL